jgi:hypothetical protein
MSALVPAWIVMPWNSTAMAAHDLAFGTVVSSSFVSVFCRLTLCTSTIGVSPVTVIVSVTWPTLSSAFTDATNVPVSSMPSRLTVLKPGSVNVTA